MQLRQLVSSRVFYLEFDMNNHDITNKMAAIAVHLRMADTYCTTPIVIDEIRAALFIALDVGEACGKTLTNQEI